MWLLLTLEGPPVPPKVQLKKEKTNPLGMFYRNFFITFSIYNVWFMSLKKTLGASQNVKFTEFFKPPGIRLFLGCFWTSKIHKIPTYQIFNVKFSKSHTKILMKISKIAKNAIQLFTQKQKNAKKQDLTIRNMIFKFQKKSLSI